MMAAQFPNDFVSIHASVKDATPFQFIILRLLNSFNPRICKRCDLGMISTFISLGKFQSTHL